MRFRPYAIALLAAVALSALAGCASKQPDELSAGAMLRGGSGPRTQINGTTVSSFEGELESSTVMPDGSGGVIILPGQKREPENPNLVDARELKLKVRELAEQLVADMKDCSLQGTVALPVSFVNLNDFTETSAFGRLMGEQLFYELNQREYPVREYRIQNSVRVKERAGEFALSREFGKVASGSAVIVVGTYSSTPDAVFVNARLVRPKDGRVIRTANLVLENNATIKRMLRMRAGGASGDAGKGTMRIRDFAEAAHPPAPSVGATPFERGEDIH